MDAARRHFTSMRLDAMPKTTRLRTLGQLSPSEFENLIYDLLIAKDLYNVVWRTPGSDGGRDLECDSVYLDASGAQSTSKWYVECKRYGRSVDWPTIHPKLAYAESADADYLLLCTTSKFTPQAVTCATAWNTHKKNPRVRLWSGHDITAQLSHFPDLLSRYGLKSFSTRPGDSLVVLSLALSKTIGSFYAEFDEGGPPHSRMLQAAFAISLLLQSRMEELHAHGTTTRQTLASTAHLALDATITGTPKDIDEPSFRAFAAYACALTKTHLLIDFPAPKEFNITGYSDFISLLHRYRGSFASIALWGNFEFNHNSSTISARYRSNV